MLYNAIISGIRTGVAALVGLVLTWLLSKGIDLGEEFTELLPIAVFAVVTGLYNVAVNWLATRVHPYFGYLLGVPKTPDYGTTLPAEPNGGGE